MRGIVSSAWKRSDGGLALEVRIPPNATASVEVPTLGLEDAKIAESGNAVWVGGAFVPGTDGISAASESPKGVAFALGSGTYRFEVTGG